jgi:hypothetical protein
MPDGAALKPNHRVGLLSKVLGGSARSHCYVRLRLAGTPAELPIRRGDRLCDVIRPISTQEGAPDYSSNLVERGFARFEVVEGRDDTRLLPDGVDNSPIAVWRSCEAQGYIHAAAREVPHHFAARHSCLGRWARPAAQASRTTRPSKLGWALLPGLWLRSQPLTISFETAPSQSL